MIVTLARSRNSPDQECFLIWEYIFTLCTYKNQWRIVKLFYSSDFFSNKWFPVETTTSPFVLFWGSHFKYIIINQSVMEFTQFDWFVKSKDCFILCTTKDVRSLSYLEIKIFMFFGMLVFFYVLYKKCLSSVKSVKT